MAFGKKSQDPWDRKPEDSRTKRPPVSYDDGTPSEPPASGKGPLEALRDWNERRKADIEKAFQLPPETCPWCGREMERGYLQGNSGIFWSPGRLKNLPDAILGSLSGDGLRIDDDGGLRKYKTAWFCQSCKKMVLSMPDYTPPVDVDENSPE